MQQAREALSGKWGLAASTFLVYFVIMMAIQLIPVAGWLGMLIIGGPMILGLAIFSLTLSRKQDARLSQLFDGFNNFGNALGAYILMMIFIFLWSLLLVIPGIIAALAYAQTFFIMADDKSIGPLEALKRSKEMMKGYKWKLFYLMLRFLGWILLAILTLGIGFLWVAPYMYVSYSKFYDDIKGQPMVENNASPSSR